MPSESAEARSDTQSVIRESDEPSAIFRALLGAGVGAEVAYTAVQRLRTMIREATAAHEQPLLAAMRRQFEAVDRRFEAVDRRFEALEGRMDALEARMDGLEARMDALETRMDALEARMDALETRMDALETRMEAIEGKIEVVVAKLAEHDRKLDVLMAQMRLMLGGLGVLVTVLIAVFGFLFAS